MSRGVGGERGRGRGAGRSSVGRVRGRGGRGATYYRNSDYNEFHDYRPRQSNRGRGRNDDNRRDSYNDGEDRGHEGDNMNKDQAPRRGRPRYRNRRSQGEPQERNGAEATSA